MTDDARKLLSKKQPNAEAVASLVKFIAFSRDITVPRLLKGRTPRQFLGVQKPVRLARRSPEPVKMISLYADFM